VTWTRATDDKDIVSYPARH